MASSKQLNWVANKIHFVNVFCPKRGCVTLAIFMYLDSENYSCTIDYLLGSIFKTYFFDQTPRLLFFSLFVLRQLLYEGDIYFVGKAVDSNDN